MLPSGQTKLGPFVIIMHTTLVRIKGYQKEENKGTLTVPFVADDIPPEHKFPGLGPPGPDVKCFKQIYVPGLAVVGNLSNTDKRRLGKGQLCRRIQYLT